MKAFVWDFNNILLYVRERVDLVRDWRDADVIILWQDVRGSLKELCELNAKYYHKPVVVVQHGRGATRDYLPPNSFPLLADKICVWGKREADRILAAGYSADKIEITGSPLMNRLKGVTREPHPEKFIVFLPVITSHEEPENVQTFIELKKIEYTMASEKLEAYKPKLKEAWHSFVIDPKCATENQIHYDMLRKDFYVISKLTEIHDHQLYHGVVVKTAQINRSHIEDCIKVLRYADCVVGLEEGTFQLMAAAMGVPTVMVDGFSYGSYGGIQNYSTELIKTEASAWTDLPNLRTTILSELNEPEKREQARKQVLMDEFGDPDSDPVKNIIQVASKLAGGSILKENLYGEQISAC